MVAQPKKSRSSLGIIIFMTAAVICAAMAGLLLSYMMQQSYPQEPVKPVVVAAQDIPAGRPMVADDLRVAQWPQSSIPAGAHGSVAALVKADTVPLTSLVKGEPVLARHLSQPRSGLGVAAKLEPGVRAMAIHTDASVTLARLIYPGARVDLLATLRRPGRGWEQNDNNVKTKVILQNVPVLAVGPEIDPLSAARAKRSGGKRSGLSAGKNASQNDRAQRVVTVAVTARQSEKLALASRQGKIDMVLRSPKDRQTLETPGATSVEVLGEAPPPPKPRVQVPPVAQVKPPPARTRRRRHRRRRRRRHVAAAEPAKPAGPEIYKVGVGRR